MTYLSLIKRTQTVLLTVDQVLPLTSVFKNVCVSLLYFRDCRISIHSHRNKFYEDALTDYNTVYVVTLKSKTILMLSVLKLFCFFAFLRLSYSGFQRVR